MIMNDRSDEDPQSIRQRMAAIRVELDEDVEDLSAQARELSHWQHYVQEYPWGAVTVAVAVGFLAVPRRLNINSPDPEALEELAKKHRLVVENRPRSAERPGLGASMLNMIGHMVLRAGVAYVGQQAGRLFGNEATSTTKSREGGSP